MRILLLLTLASLASLWSSRGSAGCLDPCNTSRGSVVVEPSLQCAELAFHATGSRCGCGVGVHIQNDCVDSLEVCFGGRFCEAAEPGEATYYSFPDPKVSGRHTWNLDVTTAGVKHDVQVSADVEMVPTGGCSANGASPRAGVPDAMLLCAMLLVSAAGLRRRTRVTS